MSFSQKLCFLMDNSKISAYKMSKETGISDRLIGYWRKGEKMPGAENLIIIANYFNTSIDYLLDRDVSNKIVDKSFKSDIKGDNNGNVGYNIKADEPQIDGLSKEMITEFEQLGYIDKVKVMSLIAELREKKGV